MISCNYCIATKVINYIHVLSNFHKSRQPPDVLREELWDRGVSSWNIGVSDLRYFVILSINQVVGSMEPSQVTQVMEHQAEMIRFF